MNIESVRTSGTSAEIISDIFEMHFPDVKTIYDATYGKGTFWKWNWRERGLQVTAADLYTEPLWTKLVGSGEIQTPFAFFRRDFRRPIPGHYEVTVFDPPFTANGPNQNDAFQHRYGADRSFTGAPQNISEVQALLAEGIISCALAATHGIIVKTQCVVESGKFHDSESVATETLKDCGFRVEDKLYFRGARRPQPDIERAAKVKHFRNRPSVFIVAVRELSKSKPGRV